MKTRSIACENSGERCMRKGECGCECNAGGKSFLVFKYLRCSFKFFKLENWSCRGIREVAWGFVLMRCPERSPACRCSGTVYRA